MTECPFCLGLGSVLDTGRPCWHCTGLGNVDIPDNLATDCDCACHRTLRRGIDPHCWCVPCHTDGHREFTDARIEMTEFARDYTKLTVRRQCGRCGTMRFEIVYGMPSDDLLTELGAMKFADGSGFSIGRRTP